MPGSSSSPAARVQLVGGHLQGAEKAALGSSRAGKWEQEPPALVDKVNSSLVITFNRPSKLNTSNTDVVRLVKAGVESAEVDPSIAFILIKGKGPHFCAGGDVVSLAALGLDNDEAFEIRSEHWPQQYLVSHVLATCTKPIVSLMNGVTFGGGLGYSGHGAFRVVTKTTQIAMPETKIGLFPDVGSSFLYSRMDGQVGTYLAFTSTTLVGPNAVFSGLATHYVPSNRLPALEARLLQLSYEATHEDVHAVIDEFNASEEDYEKAFSSYPYVGSVRQAIDHCFAHDSMKDILPSLSSLSNGNFPPSFPSCPPPTLRAWTTSTLITLRPRSPTSLKITLRALRLARPSSIETTFRRDCRFTIACCAPSVHRDFLTGVETLLVRKNKPEQERPAWDPPTVEEVDEKRIEEVFFADEAPFEKPEVRRPDYGRYRREREARGARLYADYEASPHAKWALPSEQNVGQVVRDGTYTTRSEIEAEMLRRTSGKQGTRQKVREVLGRKTVEENGKLYLLLRLRVVNMVFSRLSRLLTASQSALDESHPAYAPVNEARQLASRLEPYIERNTKDLVVPRSHPVPAVEVHKVWNDLLEATEAEDWEKRKEEGKMAWRCFPGMCSGRLEAVCLQHFALMQKPKRVLEIGVFTGTATLALALIPSVKRVTALDIEPYLKSFAEPFWERAGVASKIDYLVAPALESLHKLAKEGDEGYDLVFIDADKPGYQGYVEKLLETGLLKEDGVILADNTLAQGNYIVQSSAPRGPNGQGPHHWLKEGEAPKPSQEGDRKSSGIDVFNKWLVNDRPDLEVVQLPIRDGITVIRRAV
ncbi:hypothetical protein JCM8547_005968 [Rhodosporidiobolus lusitaniae]